MNNMIYKGYTACIEYDDDDAIFVGHLVGTRDIVSFHGTTVAELKAAFHEAVDHYLEVCTKRGETPQRPYSGNLTLRMDPNTHAAVATAAQARKQSINQWASEILGKAASIGERGEYA